MSEQASESRSPSRSGLLIAVGLVAMVVIVAGFAWTQSDRTLSNTTIAASPPQTPQTTTAQNQAQIAPGDETLKLGDQLRQQVNDLDADRKELSLQLDAIKRQLSETQGDLKLLSEQLGSLSERVDSLSASRASMPIEPNADRRKGGKSR